MSSEGLDTERGRRVRAGLLSLWLIGFALIAIASLQPPAPRPVTAPADTFAAARALVHVRALARVPHPLGTPEHARTRETLIRCLQQMGLTPHVQTASVVGSRASRPFRAAAVSNVWVRVRGRASTGTVLLAAHYDSVPTGPGASDDAASVAAILETLRALHARYGTGLRLRNDLVLLFTDGEEAGLFGARAFVESRNSASSRAFPPSNSPLPTLQKPVFALNFEARGASGPSLMFETGPQNDRLAHQFVRAVPNPTASSLFYAVYKILPNDTDFTEFRGAGMRGLNFAFINRVSHYHSALDNVERLDARSLQHQGDNMLGLAQSLGDAALTDFTGASSANQASGDAIYFNYAHSALILYPETWAIPLAALATLLTLAFVIAGARTGCFAPRGLFLGVFLVPLAAALALGLSVLLTRLLTALAPAPRSLLYLGSGTLAGVILLSLSLACAAFARVQPPAFISGSIPDKNAENNPYAPDGIVAGAVIWWLLLTWLTALKLPGGSYLFAWPLLFVLALNLAGFALARGASAVLPHNARLSVQNAYFAVLLVTSVPAVLLVLPTLCLLFSTLTVTALPLIGALVVLTVALLRPHFATVALLFPSRPYGLPLLAALVGALLLGVDTTALRPTPARPQTDSLFYALNGDTGQALWASDDRKPDAWTTQFLGVSPRRERLPDFLPASGGTFLQAAAPATPLPPPIATLLSDSSGKGTRVLRLHIASLRHAPILEIAAPDADVSEAEIEGRPVSGSGQTGYPWSLLYFNVPAQGINLVLRVRTGKSFALLTLHVIDRSYGLPTLNGKPPAPRPDTMIPTPATGWYQDTTLVSKTFRF